MCRHTWLICNAMYDLHSVNKQILVEPSKYLAFNHTTWYTKFWRYSCLRVSKQVVKCFSIAEAQNTTKYPDHRTSFFFKIYLCTRVPTQQKRTSDFIFCAC